MLNYVRMTPAVRTLMLDAKRRRMMRPLHEIIVHCSATRPKWMEGETLWAQRQEIKSWHVGDRGWSDIGYHFLIGRDGDVVNGRPLSRTGAHVRGRNTGTVGVCLLGGHGSNERDDFEEHFTEAQERALVTLIRRLMANYPTIAKVSGHNTYAAKACPGFQAEEWWESAQYADGENESERSEDFALGGEDEGLVIDTPSPVSIEGVTVTPRRATAPDNATALVPVYLSTIMEAVQRIRDDLAELLDRSEGGDRRK